MKTCETCRHWEKSEQQHRGIHKADDVAFCTKIEPNDMNAEDFQKSPALAGMDYPVCSLLTKRTFGCVLHEEKVQK